MVAEVGRWLRSHALLIIIGLAAAATVGARIVTNPQGALANAEFFRSYLITSVVTTALCWVAAFRGRPPHAARGAGSPSRSP
ncbi:hypothetical protein [Paractinoplanes durhamensis]|uniref:hypothetical protein n=1 Tax=Paractinoplanes durhamensis TaxID=113563 RepID=UPI0036257AE5